tara:strand:- start:407 stop:985 length:579 start_codon:yes stop_codon:yes gene_type:complete
MFVFLYFVVVFLINLVAFESLHLNSLCDPELARKTWYIFYIISVVGHLILFEAGRLTGLLKKRRLGLEIIMLIVVIFVSVFYWEVINFNKACTDDIAVKNKLINGVKECIVRDSEGASTNFESVMSFRSESTRGLKNFQIIRTEKDSCFNARAVPKKKVFTWFEIHYNPEMKEVTKTCGDSTKLGCEEGNTW